MATTIVPPFDEPIVVDLEDLRTTVRGWLEQVQGDADKCGTIDDANYYQGTVDGLTTVLRYMTGQTQPQEETPA
jgi:hypothetical protein